MTFCRYRICSDILKVCLKKGKREKGKKKTPPVVDLRKSGKAGAAIKCSFCVKFYGAMTQ